MLRNTMFALFAVASLAILSPTESFARGGFGGGGFHGGGFHGGGFHGGGGWRGGGWRGPAFGALGLGVGLGLAGAYSGYGYPYGYGYGYPASYAYYGDEGCYFVRRRIWTSYGWRLQPVRVCN
jgi:hypothetical protein